MYIGERTFLKAFVIARTNDSKVFLSEFQHESADSRQAETRKWVSIPIDKRDKNFIFVLA